MNAEFPDQISDHDPQVVRVVPLPSWVRADSGSLTSVARAGFSLPGRRYWSCD